ncbi:alpha/beta fold hydrolase [Thermodesulfobacteriota bacterium]
MTDTKNSQTTQKISYVLEDNLTIVGDAWGSPENRAVLLVHGGGQTRYSWGNTALQLTDQGWYSIAIDLRGHGNSDWHPRGDYRIDAFAEDLRVIASTFDQPPVLVGASLGGLSGLIAEGESDLPVFSSIILVDVAHRHENEGAERIISFMGKHMEIGFSDLEEAVEAIASYIPHRSRPADLETLEKNLWLGSDGRYYWHWDPKFLIHANEIRRRKNFKRFTDAGLSLRIPTLLVRGHMSDVISKEVAMEFLKLVPHAKFADVQGAGHMISGDRNDAFSESIIKFLRDLKESP